MRPCAQPRNACKCTFPHLRRVSDKYWERVLGNLTHRVTATANLTRSV